MLSRFATYFDEVARRGSIRRASEYLNITPSAIDRQIQQMEERLGVPLFDRIPQGMRLTSAGELLLVTVRRWRRELRNVEAQLDELRGLRRGEVSLALVEGGNEFLTRALRQFSQTYPGIAYKLQVTISETVLDRVLKGEADIGVTFNPPDRQDLRIESVLVYQVGAVMRPEHPLAARDSISLAECADHPLIGPDESNVLRNLLDRAWARSVGGTPRFMFSASSITLIKSLVLSGAGIGFLTPIDVAAEVDEGRLRFVPLAQTQLPLSVLSLITASGRTQSTAASLLLNHLSATMAQQAEP